MTRVVHSADLRPAGHKVTSSSLCLGPDLRPAGHKVGLRSRRGARCALRSWSASDGRLLASLYNMLDAGRDWLLVAPDGRIDGSEAALTRLVAWRLGDRVVSDKAMTQGHRVRGLWQSLTARPRS
jgi:hypothetical protein